MFFFFRISGFFVYSRSALQWAHFWTVFPLYFLHLFAPFAFWHTLPLFQTLPSPKSHRSPPFPCFPPPMVFSLFPPSPRRLKRPVKRNTGFEGSEDVGRFADPARFFFFRLFFFGPKRLNFGREFFCCQPNDFLIFFIDSFFLLPPDPPSPTNFLRDVSGDRLLFDSRV